MAGIQRFITYIYAYEEGKKGANKGFAKVEIRGNDCRMEIHIRDIRRSCQAGEIFLIREMDEKLESISIGEMRLIDGRGDYGIVFKTERIKNTECSFRDMEGVMILIEDDFICLSRWREGKPIDVRVENIKRLSAVKMSEQPTVPQQGDKTETKQLIAEAAASQATAMNQSEEAAASQASTLQQPEEAAASQVTTLNQSEEAAASQATAMNQSEEAAASQATTLNQSEEVMVSRSVGQQQEAGGASEWQDNIQATEIPMRNVFPQYQWLEVWEELQNTHPSFTLHQEKEILCVRIELKDLRELPQKYWYFGNNSFLLHGFFNYRYLVIGRLEVDRWFIGVPGIYQPQERVMAAIFGFTEFLPQDEPVEIN